MDSQFKTTHQKLVEKYENDLDENFILKGNNFMVLHYNLGDDKFRGEFNRTRGVLDFIGSCTKIWSYLYFDGKRVAVFPPTFIDKNLFVSPLEKFISSGPLKIQDYALDLLFVMKADMETVDRGCRSEDLALMKLLEEACEWGDKKEQLCEKFFDGWVLTRPSYLSSFEAFFGIKDIPSKLPFNNEGGVFVDVSSHGAWQKRVQKVEEIRSFYATSYYL